MEERCGLRGCTTKTDYLCKREVSRHRYRKIRLKYPERHSFTKNHHNQHLDNDAMPPYRCNKQYLLQSPIVATTSTTTSATDHQEHTGWYSGCSVIDNDDISLEKDRLDIQSRKCLLVSGCLPSKQCAGMENILPALEDNLLETPIKYDSCRKCKNKNSSLVPVFEDEHCKHLYNNDGKNEHRRRARRKYSVSVDLLPFSLSLMLMFCKRFIREWSGSCLFHLKLLLVLVVLLPQSLVALEMPPRYSRDAMPNTSFTCDDKASGGYYADPESECQMFHVCVRVSEEEINDHKFLCPNDTIFDQQNFICASWWDTDCDKSKLFYNKNDLYRVNDPWATTEKAQPEEPPSELDADYEYFLEYVEGNEPGLSGEYDYQYYESTSNSNGKQIPSHVDNSYNFNGPPLARSVSESVSLSNSHSPSKGYKISTKVGSEKTVTPTVITTPPPAESSTLSSFTFKRSTAKSSYREALSTTPSTTRRISTTQKSLLEYPFEANFDVGQPVVSVSSTSSRLEVSSPRYETSTPQYGYFSVQPPSSTPNYKRHKVSTTTARPIISTTYPSTTTEKVIYKKVKEYRADDLASYSDAEDPFANIDWKRDSSSVTATTRTRYETSFSPSVEERRESSAVFPIGRQRKTNLRVEELELPPKQENKKISVTSSSSTSTGPSTSVTGNRAERDPRTRFYRNGSITGRRRSPVKDNINEKPKRIFTGPSRQDFSNFRYFKTAFGNSENSKPTTVRPNRSRQSTRQSSIKTLQDEPVTEQSPRPLDSLFARRLLGGQETSSRRGRTASRNTRYSIYA